MHRMTRRLLALITLIAWLEPAARGAVQEEFRSLLRHGPIAGRIVGPDGAPVASAALALVPAPAPLMLGFDGDLNAPPWLSTLPAVEVIEHASSDADGRFAFAASPAATGDGRAEQVLADVRWTLVASAPLLRPSSLECPGRTGAFDAGDVQLARGAGLRGALVDQDGAAVAGATITLDVPESGGWEESRKLRAVGPALIVRSDAAGLFQLPSVPAGTVALRITHPDTASLELEVAAPAAGALRDLGARTLRRGARIAGRVLDAEGHGVPGACLRIADGTLEVSPYLADPVVEAREELMDAPVFVSGTDGRFELTGVHGPSAHVLVLAPGCEGALLHAVAAGRTDVEIRLARERSLLVQVTGGPDAEPLLEAEVLAVRAGGPTVRGVPLPLPVQALGDDEDRVWRVGQVGPAMTFLQVTAPGHAPATLTLDGVAPGSHRLVTVELRRAAVLEGLFVDHEDRPQADAALVAVDIRSLLEPSDSLLDYGPTAIAPVRSRQHASARSDGEGRFRLAELHPGMWSVGTGSETMGEMADLTTSLAYGSTSRTVVRLPDPAHRAARDAADDEDDEDDSDDADDADDEDYDDYEDYADDEDADADDADDEDEDDIRNGVVSDDSERAADEAADDVSEMANDVSAGAEAAAVVEQGIVAFAEITGRVLSGDEVVSGATVWAERVDQASLLRPHDVRPSYFGGEGTDVDERDESTFVHGASDESGAFTLRVPAGREWLLYAASQDGGVTTSPVLLPLDEAEAAQRGIRQDITLGSHRILVTVRAADDGTPLPGCWVWSDPGPISTLARNAWRTDAAGRYELRHLEPGRHTVFACLDRSFAHGASAEFPSDDVPRTSVDVVVEPGGAVAAAELVLTRTMGIHGIVRTADGTLVPDGTKVEAFDVTNCPPILSARTKDGAYSIQGVTVGEWDVVISEGAWPEDRDSPSIARATVMVTPGASVACDLVASWAEPPLFVRPLTRKEYFEPTAFNPAQWCNEALVGTGVRIRMIDDLLEHHPLVGLTRGELVALLGEAETRVNEPDFIRYYLGDERGFLGIDSEWLDISFDADGRVCSAELYRD